jgi:maleamate amidohydrolase
MSIEENYARGGFGHHLQPGKAPALVIIDFVEAYVRPGAMLYADCDSAHQGAIKLLQAARQAQIPIVHTNVSFQKGGRNGGVFFRKVAALRTFEEGADPALQAFAKGLQPAPDETVITKQYASAFFGTTLSSTLSALGVDTLLIAGVSTSGCVRATGLDACQHGFIPLVVRDAVGDRAPGPHEAALFDLQAKYAEVIDLEFARSYLAKL